MKFSRVVHGVPKWLLEEYLQELGGQLSGENIVGEGWVAEYRRIEDKKVGSIVIGRHLLEIDGDEASLHQLLPHLEMKLLRGGG